MCPFCPRDKFLHVKLLAQRVSSFYGLQYAVTTGQNFNVHTLPQFTAFPALQPIKYQALCLFFNVPQSNREILHVVIRIIQIIEILLKKSVALFMERFPMIKYSEHRCSSFLCDKNNADKTDSACGSERCNNSPLGCSIPE